MIDWMKYRWLYLLISGVVILSGVFSLLKWGLQIGVEFKGGTLIEYSLNKDLATDKISQCCKRKWHRSCIDTKNFHRFISS